MTLLLVLMLLLGSVGWWWWRPDPVGAFIGSAAQARYHQAYEAGMTRLPKPNAVLEVRTDLGVVRVNRFDGPATGPAVVLLPDRHRAAPDWEPLLPRLQKQRTVFTVDMLGDAGMSVPTRAMESDSDASNWLLQVLQRLPGGHFVLVGEGSGAWAATNLVVRRQGGRSQAGPVAGLVLIDPEQVLSENNWVTDLRRRLQATPGRPESWQRAWLTHRTGHPISGASDELALAGIREHVDGSRVGTVISERQLKGIELPVLVILSRDSTVHDRVASAALARNTLPSSQVVELAGSDPIHTRMGELYSALGPWLQR